MVARNSSNIAVDVAKEWNNIETVRGDRTTVSLDPHTMGIQKKSFWVFITLRQWSPRVKAATKCYYCNQSAPAYTWQRTSKRTGEPPRTAKAQQCEPNGWELALVQIDFSVAFDRVIHGGLVFKLREAGVGGSILKVFQYFLSSHTQRVKVDGVFSSSIDVVSGVPQG